jgi:hypothetical protein
MLYVFFWVIPLKKTCNMKEESQRKISSPRPHTLCWCVSRGERVTNGQKEGKRRLKSRIEKQVSMNRRNSENTHTQFCSTKGKEDLSRGGREKDAKENRHTSLCSCVNTFSVTV